MWTCPKCGREFKRINQGHYCGKAPENVSEYIELQEPKTRAHLMQLKSILLDNVPEVKEYIAWSMPKYEKDKHSVSFAACKDHVSLYVDFEVLDHLKLQLRDYVIKKNAIYFPYDKELPVNLIKDIIEKSFKTK